MIYEDGDFFFKQKDYYVLVGGGKHSEKSHVRRDGVRARAGAAGSNRRRCIVCSHMLSRRQLAPRTRTVTDGPNFCCYKRTRVCLM